MASLPRPEFPLQIPSIGSFPLDPKIVGCNLQRFWYAPSSESKEEWMDPLSRAAADINALGDEVAKISEQNGFWESEGLGDLGLMATKLALIADEVCEAIRVHREIYDGDVQRTSSMTVEQEKEFVEELADILIRTLDIAGHYGFNLGVSVMEKIEKNRNRPYRHGKRY